MITTLIIFLAISTGFVVYGIYLRKLKLIVYGWFMVITLMGVVAYFSGGKLPESSYALVMLILLTPSIYFLISEFKK